MKRYLIPARETRTEIRVLNSRFLATAAPVFTVDEAKAFVARIRKEYADASHNVPAFVVGHASTVVAHCHDDGEPSGTAGRPALAVLRGSGLGDAAVVVTRYFGGTKLGTGGLVRAYGDAVRAVLDVLPLAEKVATHVVMVATPYPFFERVRLAAGAHHGQILDEDFGTEVTVTARFAVEHYDPFQTALQEMSNGTLEAVTVETNEATIMPLSDPLLPADPRLSRLQSQHATTVRPCLGRVCEDRPESDEPEPDAGASLPPAQKQPRPTPRSETLEIHQHL